MFKFSLLIGSLIVCLPCEGQWSQLGDIPFVAHHTNGFGHEGKGYVIQGLPQSNGGVTQNQFWEYDPQTDEWTSLGFVPSEARTYSIGDDLDGKYYFGFGFGMSDVWQFDPATQEFTELPSCPCEPRAHPAFVAHNDKIFVGSGSTGTVGDLKDWWVLDLITMTWSQKDDIPGSDRHHPFQFGIDGAIYVGGGHISNWLKYTIDTESWSPINDFPEGRVAGTQFSHKGRGFVLSGDAADHSVLDGDQFLVYYPDLDEWFNLPFEESMHRWAPANFIIGDDLYYFAGNNFTNGNDNHVFKFDLSSIDCIVPWDVNPVAVTENSAGVLWTASPSGVTDTLQWREVGTSDWNTVANPQAIYTIEGLTSCTEYEVRVNALCDQGGSTFSEPVSFLTKGCGACVDVSYCDPSSWHDAESAHINEVRLGDFVNTSGNNSGFAEFTSSLEVEVQLGGKIEMEIKPAYTAAFQDGNCKVWLDANGDGEFANDEVVIQVDDITESYTQEITVPVDAKPGSSRIRVVFDVFPINYDACEGNILMDGETEDYCITILDELTGLDDFGQNEKLNIYPNPTDGILRIEAADYLIQEVAVFDVKGARLIHIPSANDEVNLTDLSSGVYFLKITTNEFTEYKKVTRE